MMMLLVVVLGAGRGRGRTSPEMMARVSERTRTCYERHRGGPHRPLRPCRAPRGNAVSVSARTLLGENLYPLLWLVAAFFHYY